MQKFQLYNHSTIHLCLLRVMPKTLLVPFFQTRCIKRGLVALYNIWPGHKEDLLLQPPSPQGGTRLADYVEKKLLTSNSIMGNHCQSLTCFDTWTTHYHCQADRSCLRSSPFAPVSVLAHLPVPENPARHTNIVPLILYFI